MWNRHARSNNPTLVTHALKANPRLRPVLLQGRACRLFTSSQNTSGALEDAEQHLSTHTSYPQQTVSVKHGLNRNACPFTAFSLSYYPTPSSTRRHHGPPAVATREHAPQVWSQATYQSTISIVVGCWKNFDRDKSERPQCADCTRQSDGSASIGYKTQAQRM